MLLNPTPAGSLTQGASSTDRRQLLLLEPDFVSCFKSEALCKVAQPVLQTAPGAQLEGRSGARSKKNSITL